MVWIAAWILVACFCSCSDKEAGGIAPGTDKAFRDITLAIQKEAGDVPGDRTKAGGTLVPSDYTVLFYLFERVDSASDTDYEKFRFIRREEITGPLYTIRNLRAEGYYRFVFIATKTAYAEILMAKDLATAVYGNEANAVTLAGEATLNKSLLENCYLELFGTANTPTYGNPDDASLRETFTIDRDLQIFGDGFNLLAGMEYSTPVNVLMQRQMGVVEFECPDAAEGDTLTASFSSDYYRLYLSQMVKDFNIQKYTSENSAVFPASPQGWEVPPNGDYYSSSFFFVNNNEPGLPIFQKSEIMAAGQTRMRMYVPYTTAEPAGTAVSEIFKANYKRTTMPGALQGTEGSVKLAVGRQNGRKSYERSDTFPIYRNVKTVFRATGEGLLVLHFGTGSNGGIEVDDDIWDGEENY